MLPQVPLPTAIATRADLRPTAVETIPQLVKIQTRPSDLDTESSRPGYGLTPERIWSAYREAEAGRPTQQCDLFEDILENDGHLRGLVEGHIAQVTSEPWLVKAGGTDEVSTRIARLLEDALIDTNVDEFLEHQLRGVFTGYSLTEVEWRRVGDWWVPARFHNAPGRRFVFDPDTDEPRYIVDATLRPEGDKLRGSWVYWKGTSHRQAVRAGLLRTACWFAAFKRISVRDWLVFAERFGIPIPVGVYDRRATPEARRALAATVLNIAEAGGAVFEEGTKIEFVEVLARQGDVSALHPMIINFCNSEISKLITGATLSVETGGPGSFALGKVHEARGFTVVKLDARKLATVTRYWLGQVFLRLNGLASMPGLSGIRPPAVVYRVLPDVDPLTRAQIAATLANDLGLTLDEHQIRDEFGFVTPADAAATLRGTKTTPSDKQETPMSGTDTEP